MNAQITKKTMSTVASLALFVLISGCTQQQLTGAMEEEELYNTLGLHERALFDAEGMAPVAIAVHPFVRAGLMWDAPEGTELEGRVSYADGTWTAWKTITPRWSEGLFHTSHIDVPAGRAMGLQLRLSNGEAPTYLFAEGIEIIGEAKIENSKPAAGFDQMHQALAPSSLVHTRSDWGARSPACASGSHSPAKITIHHTATPLPDTVSVTTRLRGIQNYHIDTKGWCDIGYHYLVDWNGELWQGRYETTIGAHVLNNNTNNVGISFMGTYNSASPSAAQIDHVAELVDWLSSTYGIPKTRSYLKGHREYRGNNAGDCPGDRVQARLDDLLSGGYSGDPGDTGGDPGDTGGDPGDTGGDPGNGTLQGVVFVDQGSGTSDMSWRLPGATISSSGGSTTARSGDAYWSLSVPAGTYTVSASATGYRASSRSCTVTAGGDAWCSIGLVPDDGTAGDPGDTGGDPGDTGGDPGDTGGDPGDTGGDPGDTGGDTGDVGGDYGDNTDEPKGLVYGYVVTSDADLDTCQGPRVPGARVAAETQEETLADGEGYFELWVIPGDHLIGGSADGFIDGAAHCPVASGGEVFCCVPLIPEDMTDVPGGDDEVEEPPVGCSTTDAGTLSLLFPALMFLGLLRRRRRS